MDDPRTLFAADAAQIVDVVEQRVHQRAAGMAGRRMDHHPGRLVDHHEIAILVDDPQREILGFHSRRDRFGHLQGDDLSSLDRLVRLGRPPRDLHAPVLDQPLDLGSRSASRAPTPETDRAAGPPLSSGTVS